jgi:hypothetical protein
LRFCQFSVLPALLHSLSNSLCVFSTIVLVEIRGLDIGRRVGVWIVQKTAESPNQSAYCLERSDVPNIPLNARQDSSNIVGRTPSVLEDIQAKFAGPVDIWMEHVADEFDSGGFIGIGFFKVHD